MTGHALLTAEERAELTDLASGWTVHSARMAKDILLAADEGILPPQESIEWFIRRFRTANSQMKHETQSNSETGALVDSDDPPPICDYDLGYLRPCRLSPGHAGPHDDCLPPGLRCAICGATHGWYHDISIEGIGALKCGSCDTPVSGIKTGSESRE